MYDDEHRHDVQFNASAGHGKQSLWQYFGKELWGSFQSPKYLLKIGHLISGIPGHCPRV